MVIGESHDPQAYAEVAEVSLPPVDPRVASLLSWIESAEEDPKGNQEWAWAVGKILGKVREQGGKRGERLLDATWRVVAGSYAVVDKALNGDHLPEPIDRIDLDQRGGRSHHQAYEQVLKMLGFEQEAAAATNNSGMRVTEKTYASPYLTFPNFRVVVSELTQRKNDISLFAEVQLVSANNPESK